MQLRYRYLPQLVKSKWEWKQTYMENMFTRSWSLFSVRCKDLTFASKTLKERTLAILCIPLWTHRIKLENRLLGYLGEDWSSMLNKDMYRFYHVSCMTDVDVTRAVCPARKPGVILLIAININSRWNAVIPWKLLGGDQFLVSMLIWEGKWCVNII